MEVDLRRQAMMYAEWRWYVQEVLPCMFTVVVYVAFAHVMGNVLGWCMGDNGMNTRESWKETRRPVETIVVVGLTAMYFTLRTVEVRIDEMAFDDEIPEHHELYVGFAQLKATKAVQKWSLLLLVPFLLGKGITSTRDVLGFFSSSDGLTRKVLDLLDASNFYATVVVAFKYIPPLEQQLLERIHNEALSNKAIGMSLSLELGIWHRVAMLQALFIIALSLGKFVLAPSTLEKPQVPDKMVHQIKMSASPSHKSEQDFTAPITNGTNIVIGKENGKKPEVEHNESGLNELEKPKDAVSNGKGRPHEPEEHETSDGLGKTPCNTEKPTRMGAPTGPDSDASNEHDTDTVPARQLPASDLQVFDYRSPGTGKKGWHFGEAAGIIATVVLCASLILMKK